MKLLTISKDLKDGVINHTIIFNYEFIASDFGLEATSNLVNAFNASLIDTFVKLLDKKYQENLYGSIVNGNVKFISNNNEFDEILFRLVNSINKISDTIVIQITDEDLLLEDEQKEFFDKVISYELLHILLTLETERVRGGDNEDKKPPKV